MERCDERADRERQDRPCAMEGSNISDIKRFHKTQASCTKDNSTDSNVLGRPLYNSSAVAEMA